MVLSAIAGKTASAVFVGADLVAVGVMRQAQRLGISIPTDLSVIGFDDIPWAQMSVPTLSTIEMPLEEMACEAVDALLRRIEEATDLRRRVVFDTALIVRDSTISRVLPT